MQALSNVIRARPLMRPRNRRGGENRVHAARHRDHPVTEKKAAARVGYHCEGWWEAARVGGWRLG